MAEILLDSFQDYIAREKLFTKNDWLLLAVSGGVDSVVLCDLCFEAGYSFTVAHCNFHLRGEESEKDEAFVTALGEKYKAEVLTKKFDTEQYANAQKISIQVAARDLRYAWFKEIIESKQKHANATAYILTAHHADDNAETVLMNFFKGTGIQGLKGILPKAGKIVRPLLFAHKIDILNFAKQKELSFREDSSNASDKYSRNYIRHNIIPLIEKIYPQASFNINTTIDHCREADILYNQAIAQHKKKLLAFRNNEIHIPVLKLKQVVPLATVVFEIIKEYGFTSAQTPEILKLLDSETGKLVLSHTHRILKNRNWIIISPLQLTNENIIVIEKENEQVFFENGQLTLSQKKITAEKAIITATPNVALLDLKEIQFPLLLRKWKEGDYFYPLGMAKKKKVARFLIDKKLSIIEKEKVWVIEMNKKIIWVVNQRIDDRFKISNATSYMLSIELKT